MVNITGRSLFLGLFWAAAILAQSNPATRLLVVTHVDVIPKFSADTGKLIQTYAADTRKDNGAQRVDVMVESGRPNHFTVIETWQSRAAYEVHIANDHTKAFRAKLFPWLGSPYDERLNEDYD